MATQERQGEDSQRLPDTWSGGGRGREILIILFVPLVPLAAESTLCSAFKKVNRECRINNLRSWMGSEETACFLQASAIRCLYSSKQKCPKMLVIKTEH